LWFGVWGLGWRGSYALGRNALHQFRGPGGHLCMSDERESVWASKLSVQSVWVSSLSVYLRLIDLCNTQL